VSDISRTERGLLKYILTYVRGVLNGDPVDEQASAAFRRVYSSCALLG